MYIIALLRLSAGFEWCSTAISSNFRTFGCDKSFKSLISRRAVIGKLSSN
jgi:hypothetical protein